MPYNENGKWRGKVQMGKRRFTTLHRTRDEAKSWEVRFKKHLKETSAPINTRREPDLREKYHKLFDDPLWTMGDIFDEIAKDFELPFRYADVLSVAKVYYKKANERMPASLRMKILERDAYTCRVCGANGEGTKLHVDHIVSRSRGGLTEERNLRTLCERCNLGKHNLRIAI